MKQGKVYLVGAGPGDPGLITVRGLAVLRRADVVVADRLVHPALVDEAPPTAERIILEGHPGRGRPGQDAIGSLMVGRARQGKQVVRLKGGDPFVFGRGGEEAEALADAGVPFEVVPGVTSAVAVPAYAGIPLTHRRLASAVAIVTGHQDPAAGPSDVDWAALARVDTLVVLMGMRNLEALTAHLAALGRAPSTPAAVIQWGTTPAQRLVLGTLGDVAAKARAAGMGPPGVLVVGPVVSLAERLAWFSPHEKPTAFAAAPQAGTRTGRRPPRAPEAVAPPRAAP